MMTRSVSDSSISALGGDALSCTMEFHIYPPGVGLLAQRCETWYRTDYRIGGRVASL